MSSGAVVDHRGRTTKFLRDIKKQYFSLLFGVVMYLVTASLLEMGRRLLLGTGRWHLLLVSKTDDCGDGVVLQSLNLQPGLEIAEEEYRTAENDQLIQVQGSPFTLRQGLGNL